MKTDGCSYNAGTLQPTKHEIWEDGGWVGSGKFMVFKRKKAIHFERVQYLNHTHRDTQHTHIQHRTPVQILFKHFSNILCLANQCRDSGFALLHYGLHSNLSDSKMTLNDHSHFFLSFWNHKIQPPWMSVYTSLFFPHQHHYHRETNNISATDRLQTEGWGPAVVKQLNTCLYPFLFFPPQQRLHHRQTTNRRMGSTAVVKSSTHLHADRIHILIIYMHVNIKQKKTKRRPGR